MSAEFGHYEQDHRTKGPRISVLRNIVNNQVARAIGLSIARDGMSSRIEGREGFTPLRQTLESMHAQTESEYIQAEDLCLEGDQEACAKAIEKEAQLMAYLAAGDEMTNGGVINQIERIKTVAASPHIVITPYKK